MIILLTACIDPHPSVADLVRRDSATRLADYERSLMSWLSLPSASGIDGIVFADNSGHDMSSLRSIADARGLTDMPVEFISAPMEIPPRGVHYGHCELGIIDRCLESSHLLSKTRAFAKVTGRLFFPSLSRLLSFVGDDFLAVVDGRANLALRGQRIPYITTQLMLFDIHFYRRYMYGQRDWLRAERGYTHAENFFFEHLKPFEDLPGISLRFPFNVDPIGVGAHSGRSYSAPAMRIGKTLRAVNRKLIPNVWA
jgi:hypothetical protein